MNVITIYNQTGEIQRTTVCPEALNDAQLLSGESYIVGDYNDTSHYVNGVTVTEKPQMSLSVSSTSVKADATDLVTITNIPVGAKVVVDGNVIQVDDGIVELTFDHVGEYSLTFSLFPYKPEEVIVNAV